MTQSKNRKSRKSASIKWKIFGFLMAFTVIILIILWLCQVVFLGDIYRKIKTAEIKSSAFELSKKIYDLEELEISAKNISDKNDVCVLVLKMYNGNTAKKLISYDGLKSCAIHNMSQSGYFTIYDSVIRNGGKYLQHFRYDVKSHKYISIEAGDNKGDSESIIYAVLMSDEENNDVLLILNSVVSPVESTVKTLNILLSVISVLMVLLALVLSAVISKKISKPIIDINKSAKELAKGNYGIRFNGGSYREITELSGTLNYAAYELSKVDSLRKEFVANISHDLRTPLTMITGYAEIMKDIPGENTKENAQVIIDESNRLTSLVNDVLDISKLENGTQTLNIESFDLTEAIKNVLSRYNRFVTEDGYVLDFVFAENVIVFTDKSKFLQAFYNILNNAITYTGEDKRVNVNQNVYYDMNEKKRYVRISVSDTGEGIPKEKMALIWDRYYKINSNHKRAALGTGLGLSIVNKIMHLLGGRCGVQSKIGEGSTFYIEIPIE